jgi:hypothetical protein
MECPYCKEVIKDNAIKCKHCHEWLNESSQENTKDITNKINDGLSSAKDSITDAAISIFGKNEIKNPTNNDPLRTSKGSLIFYGDHFINYGKKIDYNEIRSIDYKRESMTLSYLINTQSTSLDVKYKTGSFRLSDESMYLRLKHAKEITNAYLICSARSFRSRVEFYIAELSNKGFIAYNDNVKIHKNGLLEVKGKTINLKDAFKTGTIINGTVTGTHGVYYSSKPDEIGAKLGKTSHVGIFSGAVLFRATYNRSVISKIIDMIASDQI